MLKHLSLSFVLAVFLTCQLQAQTPVVSLSLHVASLYHPIELAGLSSNKLLIAQTDGRIRIIENGQIAATAYLDISDRIFDLDYNGIFGFCLHPNYAVNGFVYVHYFRKSDKAAVIARYTRKANNPNQADAASEQIIYTVPYVTFGHRSGRIAFGPDGYLYITTGDSAPGGRTDIGDPNGYAQNLRSPFGKLMRIDVDGGNPYAIPPDNPFASPSDSVPDELYALGLRNPWRWSFDRQTGDLWLPDLGQNGQEEINFVPVGAPAPQNYGWRCYEGTLPYITTGCSASATFAFPFHTYMGFDGGQRASITGGFVYRGQLQPALKGWYVYGDWERGSIWTLKRETNGSYRQLLQPVNLFHVVSFGEGSDGELYALSFDDGNVYRITTVPMATVRSGSWHNPATWNCACVPGIGDAVTISAGHLITIGQPASAAILKLKGTVRYQGGSLQLSR